MPESPAPWWKTHFDADSLAGYGLPRKTAREVRGAAKLLGLRPPAEILDLGCGAGRHALGLAALGHRVMGLDWSRALVAAAARAARVRGLDARFVRGDMRALRFKARFDGIVNLFTSFGYFDSEAEDLAVLRGVRRALRPGGVFLIDLLNKPWLLRHFTPSFRQRAPEGEVVGALNRLSFEPRGSRLTNRRTLSLRGGGTRETRLEFKVYGPEDLQRLFKASGLELTRLWGGFDGRRYGKDTFRLIAAATPARGSSRT